MPASSAAPPLPAGTQVVVLAAVPGSGGRIAHPRGAVGIVTRTPAGTGETLYLVRFPDGFEAAFPREQLDILKSFKDRLGHSSGNDILSTSSGFDLDAHVIYRCVTGSRAYGLDREDSDTDIRGIYLAPPALHWSLYGAPEQFEDNAAQACYWELQKFIVMALKANPNILECLYSPLVEKVAPPADGLLAIRECFLSRMIFQTFNGYALSQFKKIEQDIRNQGAIRWKHAMHLIRLLLAGAAALREGRMAVRIESTDTRERLLAVKNGALPWREVDAWRGQLHRDFEDALAATALPERPDYETVNAFLVTARREAAVQTVINA
jgi:predicted nucleotidyltransferase